MWASNQFKEIDTKNDERCIDWFYTDRILYHDVWGHSQFLYLSYKGFLIRLGGRYGNN